MIVEMLQITAEQARMQLFVALELAHNLLSLSSRLRDALQDRQVQIEKKGEN